MDGCISDPGIATRIDVFTCCQTAGADISATAVATTSGVATATAVAKSCYCSYRCYTCCATIARTHDYDTLCFLTLRTHHCAAQQILLLISGRLTTVLPCEDDV